MIYEKVYHTLKKKERGTSKTCQKEIRKRKKKRQKEKKRKNTTAAAAECSHGLSHWKKETRKKWKKKRKKKEKYLGKKKEKIPVVAVELLLGSAPGDAICRVLQQQQLCVLFFFWEYEKGSYSKRENIL